MKRNLFLPLGLLLISTALFAQSFSPHASYEVCFTPGENCTQKIVDVISHAQKNIYVQTYSFTDSSIAKALSDAKHRDVDVNRLYW